MTNNKTLHRRLSLFLAWAGVLWLGTALPAHADSNIASPAQAQADSASHPDKPWQANISLTATHGLLALGRDFGLHYGQVALQSIGYSSQDGLVYSLGVGYARRFFQGDSPYVGFALELPWSEESNWNTGYWLPGIGYEIRKSSYHFHLETFLGTPLNSDFTEAWGFGFGLGFGIPF
jgi:hypothetical protein